MSNASDYPSIEAAGAVPGDVVECTADNSGLPFIRFEVGQRYSVVDFEGRPSAHGHTDDSARRLARKSKKDDPHPPWMIPWLGYGFRWKKISA